MDKEWLIHGVRSFVHSLWSQALLLSILPKEVPSTFVSLLLLLGVGLACRDEDDDAGEASRTSRRRLTEPLVSFVSALLEELRVSLRFRRRRAGDAI
jgi:hypothetical protein